MWYPRSTVGGAVAIAIFVWSGSARAPDDDAALKARVLKEYPEALRALEARFASAFGSVVGLQEMFVGKPNHMQIRAKFTFAAKAPDFAKAARIATSTTMRDGKTSSPKETVFCSNKENSFWLVRDGDKPEFTIRSFSADKDGQTFIKSQMASWLFVYLHAPFSLGGLSMRSVIADNYVAVKQVSAIHQDEEALIRIAFDFESAKSKQLRKFKGWVLVAPEAQWTVREYEIASPGAVFHGRVEYVPSEHGSQLPKRVTSTRTVHGQKQPSEIETYEFNELHLGDVPDMEFQLSAFGLPERPASP